MGLGRTVQACALACIAYLHVGAFQLFGPEPASRLRAGQLGIARAGSMCSRSPLVPVLRQTFGRCFKATAGRDNEVEDERVARAKSLIQRVESATRRHSGERRVTEPSGGGATGGGAGGGVFKGVVVAVTGNFNKMRPEVEERIKRQAATFSGTVHKRVDFLICDEGALNSRTKHVRKAEKFGTKIVSLDFMEKSVERGSLVDHAPFLLVPPPAGAAERDDGEDEE